MNDKDDKNLAEDGSGSADIKKKKEEEEEKKNRKKMFIIIGIALGAAIILIVIILLLFTFCRKKEPVEEPIDQVEVAVETEEEPGQEIIETEIETEEPDGSEPEEEEEPAPEDEEEPVPEPEEEEEPAPEDEEEEAIAPTVSIEVYEGPTFSPIDSVCFYRIEADVTGSPMPDIEWNQIDYSDGAWGNYKIQVNLFDPSEVVNLTATVTNAAGSDSDSLSLSWGCNRPPNVDDIVISGDLFIEDNYPVSAVASDPDGDTLTYSWSVSGGSLSDASTNPTNWLTPSYEGSYSVTVTVDDGRGGTDSRTENFQVDQANNPPVLGKILIKEIPSGYPASNIYTYYDYTLDVPVSDPDGDPVDIYWEVSAGILYEPYTKPTTWTAPTMPGSVEITVTADDGNGGTDTVTKRVDVKVYVY